jgi:beta-glucanase (GH16 family)
MLSDNRSPFLCVAVSFISLMCGVSVSAAATQSLHDDFNGASLDAKTWYIPTHDPKGDGTFVGRTQFRATQDSALPKVAAGNVRIPLQSYNPDAHSFYGTEIITKQQFAVGAGLDIVVRARMDNARYRGIVGGIFLYFLKAGSDTLHDEIDFELLTNAPDQVQTNIYGEEPLGIGHSQMIPFKSGTIADYHTYEIQWRPGEVSWLIDGNLVRRETKNIPTHPMNFYLNAWAPDPGWPEGYSKLIQPARSKETNIILNALYVDTVVIRPLGH